MGKLSFIIAVIITLCGGIASFQSGFFENYEITILFLLLEFIFVYLFMYGTFRFFHNIGKNAGKIVRKEGSKYEKTLGSEYIRELPNYYTPALVSFVQDQAIEYNKDILGTILHLINKGYLAIENDKLVSRNKDISQLHLHEKYIYQCILNNIEVKFSDYKNALIEDAYKLELMKKADNSKFVLKGIFKIFFGRAWLPIFLCAFVITIMPLSETIGIVIIIMLVLAMPIFMFARLGKGISYLIAAGTRKVELSNKGKLDQEKIYMFKNFLKEFTSMDKKNVQEIHMWDEYLTYALVLGVNKKIYEDENLRNIVNRVQEIIVSDFQNDMLS